MERRVALVEGWKSLRTWNVERGKRGRGRERRGNGWRMLWGDWRGKLFARGTAGTDASYIQPFWYPPGTKSFQGYAVLGNEHCAEQSKQSLTRIGADATFRLYVASYYHRRNDTKVESLQGHRKYTVLLSVI